MEKRKHDVVDFYIRLKWDLKQILGSSVLEGNFYVLILLFLFCSYFVI